MKLLILLFLPLQLFATKDYGSRDIIFSDTVITGSFTTPKLLNTTLPDLNTDGIYVVQVHEAYSYGGGFAHLKLEYNTGGKTVLYTQGTILEKKKGIWSRYFDGFGFKTTGNIICKNVTFRNFNYLFSPFGMKETEKIELVNCKFENVARVFSSCLYGAYTDSTWANAIYNYPTDGSFRFSRIIIDGCEFSNIYTSIIWGCPPTRFISVTNSIIRDCQTIIAPFNFYFKRYGEGGSDEGYWMDKCVQYMSGNTFKNINVFANWTIGLIRTSGFAQVVNNTFDNVSPQIVLFYGSNSSFEGNKVNKVNNEKEQLSTVILVKNVGSPVHVVKNNTINAPYSVFVAVEGTASFIVQKNYGQVKCVFNKQNDIPGDYQFLRLSENSMRSEIVLNIASRDSSVKFGSVEMIGNSFSGVVAERYGKVQIVNYQKL